MGIKQVTYPSRNEYWFLWGNFSHAGRYADLLHAMEYTKDAVRAIPKDAIINGYAPDSSLRPLPSIIANPTMYVIGKLYSLTPRAMRVIEAFEEGNIKTAVKEYYSKTP